MQGTGTRNELPTLEEIQSERERLQYGTRYRKALTSTLYVLVVVAAVAVLVSMLFMPVFQITGSSMEPNLNDGDIVVSIKSGSFQPGQICGFYYNNKLLLKRVIASAGDWVSIDPAGFVSVNGETLEEPYVADRSLGITDITYPYQVPDGSVFVLGDHRSTSIDSRSSLIGCIKVDEIVGKIVVRIWPLQNLGPVR